MIRFLAILLPFGVVSIAGMIRAGYGESLWFWLAYALFFLFVWEARVLCRHRPFWAGEGNILHCHANYGVFKMWPYQPGPMSQAEKIPFAAGALFFILYPFPFLLSGGEYLLAFMGVSSAFGGAVLLRAKVCSRCINFSCPLNTVPKQ